MRARYGVSLTRRRGACPTCGQGFADCRCPLSDLEAVVARLMTEVAHRAHQYSVTMDQLTRAQLALRFRRRDTMVGVLAVGGGGSLGGAAVRRPSLGW